jgi:nucleotide-binding universal stress UspA family protein
MSAFELGTDGPNAILVGVDGSPTSLRAAAYAAGLARRQGARLVVVFVRTVPATVTMVASAASAVGAVRDTMNELADQLRAQILDYAQSVDLPVVFEVASGEPFAELVRAAEKERADAVVVGASARADHRLVGSIAVRLVRAARWPVTVVP